MSHNVMPRYIICLVLSAYSVTTTILLAPNWISIVLFVYQNIFINLFVTCGSVCSKSCDSEHFFQTGFSHMFKINLRKKCRVPKRHYITGLYNRHRICPLWDSSWIFIHKLECFQSSKVWSSFHHCRSNYIFHVTISTLFFLITINHLRFF